MSLIRSSRLNLGLTLTDLAQQVGTTPGNLSLIETGRHAPRRPLAAKIARRLGISVVDIYYPNGVNSPALPNTTMVLAEE
jgi:DNA-binding XRE family transcriptional regulator